MAEKSEYAAGGRQGVRLRRVQELPGVELYQGNEVTVSIPRHMHWFFSLGVCTGGLRIHRTMRQDHYVTPGSVVVINCGEVHSGVIPSGGHYSNRLIRLDGRLVAELMGDIAACPRDFLEIPAPVIRDNEIAHAVAELHSALAQPVPKLEKQSRLLAVVGEIYARYAAKRGEPRPPGSEKSAVKRACDYLNEHYAENLSLDELARVAGLNPYYLTRVFTRQLGLPPHTYLIGARLKKAADLLAAGKSPVETALETGFCDQSHFHRVFKKKFGITPGQYER